MDMTFKETAATPNAALGKLQDAAGGCELTRQLIRILLTGDPNREPGGASLNHQDLKDAALGGVEAADQEPGSGTKCAYCALAFESGEQHLMLDGKLYHGDVCAHFAKQIATAAK
jgi:hypothetical protein